MVDASEIAFVAVFLASDKAWAVSGASWSARKETVKLWRGVQACLQPDRTQDDSKLLQTNQ
jgi:hypothetical protein